MWGKRRGHKVLDIPWSFRVSLWWLRFRTDAWLWWHRT